MRKYILILIILINSLAFSQIKQAKAKMDYASFPLNYDSLSLELYFEVSSKDVKYNPDENQLYKAKLNFEFIITNELDTNKEINKWDFDAYNKIEDLKKDLQIIGIKRFVLLANRMYNISILMKNENQILYNSNFNFFKKVSRNSKLNLSDIEFAYDIQTQNPNSKYSNIFDKNGLTIVPNPTIEMFGNDAEIRSYFEIMNQDTSSKKNLVKYEILNGINKTLNSFEYDLNKISSSISIESRSIPIFDITTGIYSLKVTVYTNNFNDSAVSIKKFYYLNPQTTPKLVTRFKESQAFEESLFTSMTEDKINIEFEKTKPILNEYEIDEFKRLSTLKAKQRALFKFWKYRDNDTTSEKNEMYIDYQQRLDYIDKTFSFGIKDQAYKTDRGRIILKYGMPTTRNKYSATAEKIACEEWFFDGIGGGLYFYFVDRSNNEQFTLVHSNARNEPKDLNWVQNYNPNIETDNSSRFKDPNDYQK